MKSKGELKKLLGRVGAQSTLSPCGSEPESDATRVSKPLGLTRNLDV